VKPVPIVFAGVVTRPLLAEYELFRASFAVYHGYDVPAVIHCDAASLPVLATMPDTIAIPCVRPTERPVSQWSTEFRDIVRHKMLAIDDAWRLLFPHAVAYFDADVVFTARCYELLAEFTAPITLSPHYWGGEAERRSAAYGFYNAGIILIREKTFASWWRSMLDEHPESFADQGSLDAAPQFFGTQHFTEDWNVGYWRRRCHLDVPEVSERTVNIHAHVFAPARPQNEFEVGQKAFVERALDMLRRRNRPEDRALLDAIDRIGRVRA
jgi:hypothetical protein